MLKCFNVKKTHIIFQILYIIVGPLFPTSLKRFVFRQAVCSDWPTDPVHCDWPNTTSTRWKCNAPFHNSRASAFKMNVKTVNNVLSFTISSSPCGWQTQWWCSYCSYVFANKPWLRRFLMCCTLRCDVGPSLSPSLSLSLSLSLTHTHTHKLWLR